MGPLWDFDCSLVINDKWSNIHIQEYSYYFRRLLQRDDFFKSYIALWENINENIVKELTEYLYSELDSYRQDINKSRILNKEIFPFDDEFTPIEEEIDSTINWVYNRVDWISEQLRKKTSVETLENDITNNKKIYNLYGQELPSDKNLPQGIYIINGKKVLIK